MYFCCCVCQLLIVNPLRALDTTNLSSYQCILVYSVSGFKYKLLQKLNIYISTSHLSPHLITSTCPPHIFRPPHSLRTDKQAKHAIFIALYQAAAESLDYIIDTVPAKHDLMPLLGLLKIDGKLVLVGVPPEPFSLKAENFIGGEMASEIEVSFPLIFHFSLLARIETKKDAKLNLS